jgi:hypothetical protein
VKDRKWRPEGGEWEPQISFKIFGRCPKLKSQEANTNTVITTALKKGGCSLGTQRITTKQERQENETLHFYRKEARSQISDTQANR